MNGWQRFGLLILGCVAVMILYPHYGAKGWPFIGMTLLVGTGAILLLSVISNIFAIYRFNFLNNLITLGVLAAIVYFLLWNFPQTDGISPIEKIKSGRTPTREDVDRGLKQLTFNFDFVRRNVRRDENYSNQSDTRTKPAKQEAVKTPQLPKEDNGQIEEFMVEE